MKIFMITTFFFLSIIFAACGACVDGPIIKDDKDVVEIQKVNMISIKEKLNYLINKLEINKKYYYKDQKKFLDYIIIGKWHNPPRAAYLFKNTKEFIMVTEDEKITGKWRFSSDGLELESNGKIKKAEILYCILEKGEYGYSFSIMFTVGSDLFLSINTSLAELWEKNPPIK
jgi:hypothetical protein